MALVLRPAEWLLTPFGIAGVGSAILVGTWAGRRGVLTDRPRTEPCCSAPP